jgi:hypothetical protein
MVDRTEEKDSFDEKVQEKEDPKETDKWERGKQNVPSVGPASPQSEPAPSPNIALSADDA